MLHCSAKLGRRTSVAACDFEVSFLIVLLAVILLRRSITAAWGCMDGCFFGGG
jgi:hypothetical protein